jgi:dCTP deaminase
MTILCDRDIRKALDKGYIEIKPPPPDERISTSAVDLTLATEFRRWNLEPQPGLQVVVDPSDPKYSYTDISEKHTLLIAPEGDGSIVLRRGDFVLAQTEEWVSFPRKHRLAARVEGRSSLARLGVAVHLTAPTIHSGFNGRITLEITNQGALPVRLRPGQNICQLIVERIVSTPSEKSNGTFVGQVSPTGRVPSKSATPAPARSRPGRRTPPKTTSRRNVKKRSSSRR